MWFICGLGNPGKEYKDTRHNLGFSLLDSISKKYNLEILKKDNTKILFKGNLGKNTCLFCKPMTFMNLSGQVIGKIVNYYKIPTSKIIIIHDDIDLMLGKIKIKTGGGSGGHNGISSIDKAIGKNYRRIRIGIGKPILKELVSSFVLERFNKNEQDVINRVVSVMTNNFETILADESLFLTKIALEIKK